MNRQQLNRLGIVACIVVVIASANVAMATHFTFQGLGDLPGGSFLSNASDVSADGSVVVGQGRSASGREVFRWTSGGGMVGLGGLGGIASAVSADGSVVVGTLDNIEAFRWTSGGGMVGLGALPGGLFASGANGVSADGSVVVGWSDSSLSVFVQGEAFRWTSGGGMVGLGTLPSDPSLVFSEAQGISADGLVIVGRSSTTTDFEPFRWTSGGGMVELGTLPGAHLNSIAFAVSADGSVVVGTSSSEAFRWTSGGGMVGLGDLPGGVVASFARDVSADGSVVVGKGESASGPEAFLWTSSGGMQNLRDLLIAGGATGLTDWTLTGAIGVSADGLTFVGTGINPDGDTEAWIATVPEPSSIILAAFGFAAFAAWGWRRRKGCC